MQRRSQERFGGANGGFLSQAVVINFCYRKINGSLDLIFESVVAVQRRNGKGGTKMVAVRIERMGQIQDVSRWDGKTDQTGVVSESRSVVSDAL